MHGKIVDFLNLVLKESHFAKSGFLAFCTLLISCQSTPSFPLRQVSALDQKYRLGKSQKNNPKNFAVTAYREGFAKTLYSKCKWFPSDSGYALAAGEKCGPVKGSLMAVSRFMMEENAATMGYDVIVHNNHLEFVSLPDECWF